MGIFEGIAKILRNDEESCPSQRPGRNEACWCGSGKKYKKCHLSSDEEEAGKKQTVHCGTT